MKKNLFLLFEFFVSTTLSHAAIVEGTCGDNLTWSLNTEDSTLIIEGSGDMSDFPLWRTYSQYIKYVLLPDGLTSIGEQAFSFCSELTTITLNNDLTNIGNSAFSGCSKLSSITIPDSVIEIGMFAFNNCACLTSITIPNSIESIESATFYNCSNLTSISLPNSLVTIGDLAFYNCTNLTSITLPNSIANIGEEAFSKCAGLVSITIPNSVTKISKATFAYCSSLTSITIPSSVTDIGDYAFFYCTALDEINNYSATPQDIVSSYVFERVPTIVGTLYVPEQSINLYQMAYGWSDFSTIQPISGTPTFINSTTINGKKNKLIRNGSVYILTDDSRTYTLTGQQVK